MNLINLIIVLLEYFKHKLTALIEYFDIDKDF